MRILLDECLPRWLKDDLPEHDVRTVPDAGWKGRKNGELLALAAGDFDVFLTVDAGIEYQQDLRIEDLRPLMPRVRQLLGTIGPGRWERVGE
jgi:predicted nuclease of predicted toxin-antitoxin system